MLKKHQTPKYIYYRLKQKRFEKKYPDKPWMTRTSIQLLEQLIRPEDLGLEYGSGRSTIWFAKRCKHLTSIEHHKKWFDNVTKKLSILSNSNVEYIFRELSDNPLDSQYYNSMKNYDNETLDFIIVDGVYRDIISLGAIDKLKKGGILILDNAERYLPNDFKIPESIRNNLKGVSENWKNFNKNVETWRKIWTTNGVTATLLLIKT